MKLLLRVLLLCSVLIFGGCGFKLRSYTPYAFNTVAIRNAQDSAVAMRVIDSFQNQAKPRLVSGAEPAEVIIQWQSEQRSKSALSYGPSGQVFQYRLILRVDFTTRRGEEEQVHTVGDYVDFNYSHDDVLAKQAEEGERWRFLEQSVASRVTRSLQNLIPVKADSPNK